MPFPNPSNYGIVVNPLVYSPFQTNNFQNRSGPAPTGDFLLLDNSNFLLLDGTNFLLLGS